jgi:hypothetical protein
MQHLKSKHTENKKGTLQVIIESVKTTKVVEEQFEDHLVIYVG